MAFLWPNGGNKANWRNIWAENIYSFSKKNFMLFLPNYCHSFRIIVIPSVLLSFLPDYFHSFHITVIPSKLLSLPFQIFVILNSCTLPYPKGWVNWPALRPYLRVLFNLPKFVVITAGSSSKFSLSNSRLKIASCKWFTLSFSPFWEIKVTFALLFKCSLKVSKFQNELMKSSFFPKYEPKIVRISAL